MPYKIKDIKLADKGSLKISWAESRMPVLNELIRLYAEAKPLTGVKIAGCLHITKETAVLVKAFMVAGAETAWCGCNPLSTQDDVAAALAREGVHVFGWRGLSTEEYYWCIEQVLKIKPNVTLDDGADLVFTLHEKHLDLIENVIGGN